MIIYYLLNCMYHWRFRILFQEKLCLKIAFLPLTFYLKVRKVEYRDPAEEEWEKFQKAMQVEAQV